MKKVFVAAIVFMAAVLAAPEAKAVVDVDARYWFVNLDSRIKATSGSSVGTEIDAVDTLGLDKHKGFPEGRITLELGSHSLRYAFTSLKWDAVKTVTQDFTYAGQTYTAGSDVSTDLKLDYHRLAYMYDIVDALNNRLALIFELKYFDTEARLKADSLGFDETESLAAPIPTVGVAAQVGLPFLFSVGGELTGVSLGKNAYLVDGEAAINIKPAPFVVISGGYRIFKLHLEKDDDKANFTLKGPFITLRADF